MQIFHARKKKKMMPEIFLQTFPMNNGGYKNEILSCHVQKSNKNANFIKAISPPKNFRQNEANNEKL